MNMLTNNSGLPEPVLHAIQPDAYSAVGASDYSATSLLKSPRQLQLEKRHAKSVTQDVMDHWFLFLGTAIHSALENGLKNNPRYIVERKILRFDKPDGGTPDQFRRVAAKFDLYDTETKTLYDHKTTTTWVHGKEMKDERVQQLNLNAYFLEKEGYPVDDVAINAIYVDWRKAKGKYKDGDEYPESPCAEFRTAAWPMEWREKFYLTKLKEHIDAEHVPDEQLPPCGAEYCWEKPAKFAVYKPGAEKARKLCNSYDEAVAYINKYKLLGYEIEHRPGARTRCENYCSVCDICSEYSEWKKANESSK